MKRLLFLVVSVLLCAWVVAPRAGAQSALAASAGEADGAKLEALLRGVRERVARYHERLFSITFKETVRRQELRADETPKGKEREFVFESIVARRASKDGKESQPIMQRRLKLVDGKPAPPEKPVEQKPAAKGPPKVTCNYTLDPPRAYGDRLSFLLPEFQSVYVFSYGGEAEFEGRKVAVLVASMPPSDAPPELKVEGNCFFLSRPRTRRPS